MKLVSIIVRDNKAYIESSGRSPDWLWIGMGNVQTVSLDSNKTEIGRAILKAISESKLEFPYPPTVDSLGAKARAAGFKTFASFANGAKAINVIKNEDGIKFIPSVWKGRKKGFVPSDSDAFFPENSSEEGIGFALTQAIAICK